MPASFYIRKLRSRIVEISMCHVTTRWKLLMMKNKNKLLLSLNFILDFTNEVLSMYNATFVTLLTTYILSKSEKKTQLSL